MRDVILAELELGTDLPEEERDILANRIVYALANSEARALVTRTLGPCQSHYLTRVVQLNGRVLNAFLEACGTLVGAEECRCPVCLRYRLSKVG